MQRNNGITRRQFVQGAAAAALAAAGDRARLGPGPPEKTPPSERITVGFIGVGKMANDFHLPTLSSFADVQALAVCDVDTTRRQHAKRRIEQAYGRQQRKDYKGCDATNDFREIIGRKDIDAVCIATPDHWHAILIVEACKAGKDVYCEKPLTLTIAEAKLCIDAVRKYERRVADRQPAAVQRLRPLPPGASSSCAAGGWARSRRSRSAWAGPAAGAICPARSWSPGWTGPRGSARPPCGPTAPCSAPAACTTTFPRGGPTANTPAAA